MSLRDGIKIYQSELKQKRPPCLKGAGAVRRLGDITIIYAVKKLFNLFAEKQKEYPSVTRFARATSL